MRHLYLFIGRLISPLATSCLKIFTRFTHRPRVRVLITNEKDEVLLLRGVLSDGRWTLPGGGVNRNESLAAAARRELYEETGIKALESDMKYIRTLTRPEITASFEAPLFQAHAKRHLLPSKLHNPIEIASVGWFDLSELPSPLSTVASVGIKGTLK